MVSKVVTICGSMKFTEHMIRVALDLELVNGYVVLQCAYNFDERIISDDDFATLGKIHVKKIDMSDAIYVMNIDGYIGESTRKEIEYALSTGKEVIYHESSN